MCGPSRPYPKWPIPLPLNEIIETISTCYPAIMNGRIILILTLLATGLLTHDNPIFCFLHFWKFKVILDIIQWNWKLVTSAFSYVFCLTKPTDQFHITSCFVYAVIYMVHVKTAHVLGWLQLYICSSQHMWYDAGKPVTLLWFIWLVTLFKWEHLYLPNSSPYHVFALPLATWNK